MQNVTLTLKDLFSGEIIERTISALNAFSSGSIGWELKDEESQKENLERWISERGNSQHETILELISWKFD